MGPGPCGGGIICGGGWAIIIPGCGWPGIPIGGPAFGPPGRLTQPGLSSRLLSSFDSSGPMEDAAGLGAGWLAGVPGPCWLS